jgi:hypothetical protein
VPSGRAVRPEAASSVGPVAIHYRDSLRSCLGTATAPRRRTRFRQTLLATVGLVERRQLVEVSLNTGRKVLGVVGLSAAAHDPQLRLAASAAPALVRVEAEVLTEPRPLGTDDCEDGAGEEHDRKPAHAGILAR